MEKMNQVSVTEFMSKSKEEIYDMAVEMVEKYNRLVDICNDSAERMADLVIERDNLSKGVQFREPGELKIKKLADVVVWADGIIRDAGYNEEKYKSDAAIAYCHVKAYELWKIRDVALESIERHAVYTNALNNDIADKEAKINLLEKEIEGRKECYTALKELMDTQYISVDDHNNVCGAYEKEVVELEEKVKHQRENLDGINKTLDIRNKENDSLVKTIQTTRREIEAHEHENKRLSERIIELKEEVKKRDKCIMEKNAIINTAAKMKEDDHGRAGFEEYIKYIIEEEEGKFKKELNERFSEEVSKISQKRTEEALAKVKGKGGIPCGEDAIE